MGTVKWVKLNMLADVSLFPLFLFQARHHSQPSLRRIKLTIDQQKVLYDVTESSSAICILPSQQQQTTRHSDNDHGQGQGQPNELQQTTISVRARQVYSQYLLYDKPVLK